METLPQDERLLNGGRPVAVAVVRREPVTPEGYVPLRVVYASDEDYSRDLGMIAMVAHRIDVAATDTENVQHGLARSIYDTPWSATESRWQLSDEFSPRVRAHRMDILVPVSESPADFCDGHPDYDVLFLAVDVEHGIANLRPMLADSATKRAYERITKITQRGGEETDAAVVCANKKLFVPGDEDLSCTVLLSFHRDADASYLRELAKYMSGLRGQTFPKDPDKNLMAKLASEDRAVRYRRRELPPSMTDGVPVYLCDLLVHRPFLKTRSITNRLLVVAAERGRRGWVELLSPPKPSLPG